jgi:uncharacterized protein involved in exopolysaccharide biosynthesis
MWDDTAGPTQQFTPKDYLVMLYRRRWVALGVFSLVITLGVLAVNRMTPIFHAEAKLLIQATMPDSTPVDRSDPFVDPQKILTPESVEVQLAVLQSRTFIASVLKQAKVSKTEVAQITATPDGQFNLITVEIDSPDARIAARVANTMVTQYIRHTRETGSRQIQAVKQVVEQARSRAEQVLEQAERDLLEYRRRRGVVELAAERESRARELAELERRQQANAHTLTRLGGQIAEVKTRLGQEPARWRRN